MMNDTDVLIIGAGIVGMTIAHRLLDKKPGTSITIIEKETSIASHASGRNSGVLHAGFYYTADSLKARFTIAGNSAMRAFCHGHNIPINECGKLVIAKNQSELPALEELERRGKANGSEVQIISSAEAEAIEPNIRTYEKALWSPRTATIDPKQVCSKLAQILTERGVTIALDTAFLRSDGQVIDTSRGAMRARKIINCAGLYADKIAHQFGFGKQFTILPFKGLYVKYTKDKSAIRTNIYPVPNLKNPFLGVHFTKTVDGTIKIGPTAIPTMWREQYDGISRFNLQELLQIGGWQARLFASNSFGFRDLAFEEMRKYYRPHMIHQATELVKEIDVSGFGAFTAPGIRAQLLDRTKSALLTDFVVEGDCRSVHVLNAISPAFTCSFPFAEYVVDSFLLPM